MILQRLFSLLTLSLLLTACAETAHKTQPKKASTEKSVQTQTDDRGFDPCLLNANLPVCTNNETSNSK